MADISAVLKQEISRLSRKEARRQLRALRKAATQYRGDIATLKRVAAKLRSTVARLERRVGNTGAAVRAAQAGAAGVRITAKGVRSLRARLGLSAAEFGKLIGVTGHSVYMWEHGVSRPRKVQLLALAGLRDIGKREAAARLQEHGAKALRARRSRK